MATFTIKQDDTAPSLQYVLSPSTIDLTGATVVFNMRGPDGTLKINRASASVVTPTGTPTVKYDWVAGDTDTVAWFEFEFEVTYNSGGIETFRNDGNDFVRVVEDIA